MRHKRYGTCRVLKSDGKKMEIVCLSTGRQYVLDIEFCVTRQLIKVEE